MNKKTLINGEAEEVVEAALLMANVRFKGEKILSLPERKNKAMFHLARAGVYHKLRSKAC